MITHNTEGIRHDDCLSVYLCLGFYMVRGYPQYCKVCVYLLKTLFIILVKKLVTCISRTDPTGG